MPCRVSNSGSSYLASDPIGPMMAAESQGLDELVLMAQLHHRTRQRDIDQFARDYADAFVRS